MPILTSTFAPSFPFRNGHFSTITPTLFRKVSLSYTQRVRINTPDHDFIDFDILQKGNKTAVLLLHGLEGDSQRAYMLGMAKMAVENGWDAVAMNHRGCSGEPNKLLSAYHSGKTEDLEMAIDYILNQYEYEKLYIIGFSLGGNIVLKYAGKKGKDTPSEIKAFAAVSVPCDLASSAKKLRKGFNMVYMNRFMHTLREKARYKLSKFPNAPFDLKDIERAKTFHDFDNFYTSIVHGFKNAEDYWTKCSSKQFFSNIARSTLLINAQNDPFLTPDCFPYTEANDNNNLFLDTPKYGGHVGFASNLNMHQSFYSERMISDFFKTH